MCTFKQPTTLFESESQGINSSLCLVIEKTNDVLKLGEQQTLGSKKQKLSGRERSLTLVTVTSKRGHLVLKRV